MAGIESAEGEPEEVLELVDLEEGEEQAAPETEDEDEFAIEIDGEEEAQDLPSRLRREIRERDRRIASYEQAYGGVVKDPGPRPTFGDGEAWGFDEDKCEAAIDQWIADNAAYQRQQEAARSREEIEQREIAARHAAYLSKMAVIQVPQAAKDAAQAKVVETLSEVQQSALLRYANDPAKMVVALAKNAAHLESLASETDLGMFILRMAKMEGNLKVVNRKKPPAPEAETIQRGSAPASSTSATKAEEALLAKGDIKGFREARKARLSKAA